MKDESYRAALHVAAARAHEAMAEIEQGYPKSALLTLELSAKRINEALQFSLGADADLRQALTLQVCEIMEPNEFGPEVGPTVRHMEKVKETWAKAERIIDLISHTLERAPT